MRMNDKGRRGGRRAVRPDGAGRRGDRLHRVRDGRAGRAGRRRLGGDGLPQAGRLDASPPTGGRATRAAAGARLPGAPATARSRRRVGHCADVARRADGGGGGGCAAAPAAPATFGPRAAALAAAPSRARRPAARSRLSPRGAHGSEWTDHDAATARQTQKDVRRRARGAAPRRAPSPRPGTCSPPSPA